VLQLQMLAQGPTLEKATLSSGFTAAKWGLLAAVLAIGTWGLIIRLSLQH
jgi:hypothetical protein